MMAQMMARAVEIGKIYAAVEKPVGRMDEVCSLSFKDETKGVLTTNSKIC